jgi:predicted transcriptional regulator
MTFISSMKQKEAINEHKIDIWNLPSEYEDSLKGKTKPKPSNEPKK